MHIPPLFIKTFCYLHHKHFKILCTLLYNNVYVYYFLPVVTYYVSSLSFYTVSNFFPLLSSIFKFIYKLLQIHLCCTIPHSIIFLLNFPQPINIFLFFLNHFPFPISLSLLSHFCLTILFPPFRIPNSKFSPSLF
jgi:hypothetical protein